MVKIISALDTRTLLVMSVFIVIATTLITVFLAFFNRKRSASIYAAGFILGLVGFLLDQVQSPLHPWLSIILGDLLINGFYFFLVWGQQSSNESDQKWSYRLWAYLGIWVLLQFIFLFTGSTFSYRHIINSVLLIVLSVEYLVAFVSIPHPMPSPIQYLTMAVGLSQVLVNIVRIYFIFATSELVMAISQNSFVINYNILVITFYLVLWAQLIIGLEVAELIEELKRNNLALKNLAVTDALTCLFNRQQFDEKASSEIERASRYEESLSLIMFDLDNFKHVNDTWGHQAGDVVLKFTASIVKKQIRDLDTLFRWGGEEFLVLAPHTPLLGAASLAEKVRNALSLASFPEAGHVTASFGVAEWEPGQTAELWLQHADQALYSAKNGGRNRVVVFNQTDFTF